uniref:Putative NADH dehydrogenase 1 alpha subcomplex 4 n=1 Tax=Lysiphlebus testaceipes TaxID=77504 RepID=Q4PP83_LYSTE|nr:putative NADH dehydrogenase 1 alpha subcomplex 4 [Lysiphlebus testaceipes]
MQGMTKSSIAKNPSLLPLYVCFAAGLIGSTGYLIRLATRNPDVSWINKNNPEPWQYYKDKQYKFWASDRVKDTEVAKPPTY